MESQCRDFDIQNDDGNDDDDDDDEDDDDDDDDEGPPDLTYFPYVDPGR